MIDQQALINAISKSAVIGITLVFGTNISCLAVSYIITKDKGDIYQLGLVSILLMIVGLADLIAGLILKGRLLAPLFAKPEAVGEEMLLQVAMRTTVVTASLCMALPLYGLVSVIIDGNMDAMLGFAIASLAGFLFLRLRPRDFKKLQIHGN